MSKANGYERAQIRIREIRESGYPFLPLDRLGLSALPPELFELSALQGLDLQGNLLEELPPAIRGLSKLKKLDVSDNRLTSVPAEIGDLRELTELYLLRNRITSLPREIRKLQNLTELYLWGNRLSELPAEMGELGRLNVLNLTRNELTDLPIELTKIVSLAELYLHGNPRLRIPAEVLGPSSGTARYHQVKPAKPSRILDFYFSSRTQALLEARIIIIGDGAAGKTSVVRQLVHDLPAREGEATTPGVVIEPWTVSLRGEQVQVNVWDFGGQEPMHAAHPYFFTERTLYIVVADSRGSGVDERIEHWLRMVATYGQGARALVVVNKTDQNAMDVARRSLCHRYPFLPSNPDDAIFGTSCTTGAGIVELRSAIQRQLGNMEQIWDRIPERYFEVKTRISEMRSKGLDTISFDRWHELCEGAQILKESERDDLLQLLRDLGLVISFPDVPKLRLLGVLNPEWVVGAIYPLLMSPDVAGAEGLLTLDEMEKTLPSSRYPKECHGWLLQLMEGFELLFADDMGRHMVPSRLPKEVPDWALSGVWYAPSALHLELRYDALPEGAISRFIARNHAKARWPGSWWRYGIALMTESCEALICAHISDAKIELRVSGPPLKRQSLVHSVRAELSDRAEERFKQELWIVLESGHAEKYEELLLFAEAGYERVPRLVNGQPREIDLRKTLDLLVPRNQQDDLAKQLKMEIHMGEVHKNVSNSTISMGNVSVTGEFTVTTAASIQASFNKANSAPDAQLRESLKALSEGVARLTQHLKQDEAENAAKDLEALTSEAISKKPRRERLEVSAKGLLEAASTVAEMADPITKAVKAVLSLIAP